MKLTAQRKRARLQPIEVLIADPDPRMARLVRHVLENFGFRNIHVAQSGAEAVNLLRHKPIDFVIAEWPMEPVANVNFIEYVRRMEENAFRDIPILLLSGRAEQRDVEKARDSGVTEFVVKPFTATTLSNRITEMIDNPRSFIIARDFVGPDRRRRSMPVDAFERRLPEDERKQYATRRGKKTIYQIHDQEITIYQPDRSLKQLIGADVTAADIFDEDVVREAQQVIMNMKGDFVGWVLVDITRLETAYGKLRSDANDQMALKEISDVALTVKAQAGTFGYNFATSIGKLLFDFASEIPAVNSLSLTIIRKHIDTLYVIFQKELHGSGPVIGEEVLEGLRGLIDKYNRAHSK
jgi:two-component system chemotaxis response regulator CheY